MADTKSNTRYKIRLLLDDLDPNGYALDTERLDELMESRMHDLAARVGMGSEWVTNAVAITSGDYDYTLPTTLQYQYVAALQLVSQEWLLEKVTPTELQLLREGATDATGTPRYYALFEDSAQAVLIWLFPTPSSTDNLNVLRSRIPAALATDATNIPFSDALLKAYAKAVALDALLLMDEEERQKRKAVLEGVPRWEREIEGAVRAERIRRSSFRRHQALTWQAV